MLSLHAILAIDFSDINGEVEKTIRVPLQYTIMKRMNELICGFLHIKYLVLTSFHVNKSSFKKIVGNFNQRLSKIKANILIF